MNAIAPLPADDSAQLPARYEAARKALAECDEIDELKTCADKHAALAVYARQANDSSLLMYANRIKARAFRRIGELQKLIPSGSGENLKNAENSRQVGAHPSRASRTETARQAGLSEHQRKTALRVAAVPEADFERQVDGPRPPTVTALAAQGIAVNRSPDEVPDDREQNEHIFAALDRLARFCEQTDARTAARAFDPSDVAGLRRIVHGIDRWLDVFVTSLPDP